MIFCNFPDTPRTLSSVRRCEECCFARKCMIFLKTITIRISENTQSCSSDPVIMSGKIRPYKQDLSSIPLLVKIIQTNSKITLVTVTYGRLVKTSSRTGLVLLTGHATPSPRQGEVPGWWRGPLARRISRAIDSRY